MSNICPTHLHFALTYVLLNYIYRPLSCWGLVTCSIQLYITLMERLSIPRQLVIIAIYLLGSFTFNSTVGDLAIGVSLSPMSLVPQLSKFEG